MGVLSRIFSSGSAIRVYGKVPTSVLRSFQNQVLKDVAASTASGARIINLGASQKDGDKEGRLYRDYFGPDCQYYTLDANRDDGDKYHLNIDVHDLSVLPDRYDLVLCMNILEHVANPFRAAQEIGGIIEKGGQLLVATPFFYPVHKNIAGGYSDYWRFTDDGLKELFPDLRCLWVKEGPSVIKSVEDRKNYWTPTNTSSGYCALFQL
jgi:SAM-dependent methyltransferase